MHLNRNSSILSAICIKIVIGEFDFKVNRNSYSTISNRSLGWERKLVFGK